jgi:hypothetical protein
MKRSSSALLNELLESAFWIDSKGDVHYNFREDTPLDDELAEKLKPRMRKLNCSNFEKSK